MFPPNRASHALPIFVKVLIVEDQRKVGQFVEKALCCPPNLIPTLYGFRLLNDFKLGSVNLQLDRWNSEFGLLLRLKRKKVPDFDGVPLVSSPPLMKALERLKAACLLMTSSGHNRKIRSAIDPYSLTFLYVLSDLTHPPRRSPRCFRTDLHRLFWTSRGFQQRNRDVPGLDEE